ncbi:unnamed protein product [Spodoptera littoralis]|uniref:UDP-glucuronosyltransferase n=1 Tax=Spodoptera littoralis TaxID=7109 RepID=A0A9P0IJ01_SPOLI|nr:unnamed protein product [Spodoptera littoralis]CAH1646837.1 unnamed protein product [Spodoptera littoralis]
MLLPIVFIMIFASACEGYKILALLPYPGKSHFMVFEPILDELARRGHHVTVVSFFPSASPHANRRDVSLVGLAPLNVEVINLQDFDNPTFLSSKFSFQFSLLSNIMAFNLQLCQTVLYSDIFEEFVKGEGAYDVVLSEHFHTDCMMGIVHIYRAPSVALMSCALTPWAFSRFGADDNPAVFPSMSLPLVDEMSFLEKLVNAFNVNLYKYWHSYTTRNEQKLVETRLDRKLPPLNELAKNASVVLVNTHHTLNGVRVLPPSVVEVGGIHLHNKTVKPLPEFRITNPRFIVAAKKIGRHILLKVFARLPQRVLWKWETEDIKGLPDNVLVLKWLPQYDLLNHPNCVAFITHGGLLSLTEIVAAGVPALVIPILGDQPGNAAFAKRAGIAEVLEFHQIDEETFYNALMKVLTPEMRDHAKSFSNRWWERPLPPMETAIHYIEKTAKYGYLNMSSPGRLMTKPELLFFMSIEYLVLFSLIFFIALLAKCFFCPQKIEKFKQS